MFPVFHFNYESISEATVEDRGKEEDRCDKGEDKGRESLFQVLLPYIYT